MSIKIRLIISYMAMILIPIILTVFVANILETYHRGDQVYVFKPDKKYIPFKKISKRRSSISRKINIQILEHAGRFEDTAFLKSLENSLKSVYTGIVVRKDNEIIYSSEFFKGLDSKPNLPGFGVYMEEDYSEASEDAVVAAQWDFYFEDNARGSIFLIKKPFPARRGFFKLDIILIIAIIIILSLTNGSLTYLISRSLIIPLKKLKHAANNIQKGKLNYEVKYFNNDEIGEVCTAFEEMRLRLKSSLERQVQYEENRKQLISSISHDLRTPVTAIKGYIEGIKDGVADTPEKIERYINTIYMKAVSIDYLIDELFLFSRLDLKKVIFDFQSVDIKAYMKDCVEELQFEYEKKNVTIRFYSQSNKPTAVIADRKNLQRVILNIIENSIKYGDKEPIKINIKLKEEKDFVVIEFRDNGQGISDEALPYIFDRFYRADPSRNASGGGSGLGLAIARQIIEEHGGQIWAESHKGVGTSIFFTIRKNTKEKADEKNSDY